MEKLFKVYVYEEGEQPIFHNGPCGSIYSMEGNFIYKLETSNFRTRDPEKASVYFLPFSVKGNYEPGAAPGDLIFVVDEKPHPSFKRDGNDLIINQRISLLDALTGKNLKIKTLDGRDLTVSVSDIVKPGHEMVIENEGMPISKEPGKHGDLKIKFDVKFPSRLTSDQKSDLRRVLGRTTS